MSDPRKALYTLESRSFVPFGSFGGGFAGDNRGFGTTADASSRVHSYVVLSPGSAGAGKVQTYSDTTHGAHLGIFSQGAANGIPNGAIKSAAVDGGAQYFFHAYGSNPMVPPAPDIDNHAELFLKQGPGMLSVTGRFTGDRFPASEWTLRDSKNTAIFLGGHMPTDPGQVWTNLFGDARRHIGEIRINIALGKDGDFAGINSAEYRGPDGKVVADVSKQTIQEWNSAIASKLTPPGMPLPEKSNQDRTKDVGKESGADLERSIGPER